MNEKNYFTIVVPLSPDAQKIVQGNPSASRCGRGLVAGGGTHEAASGRCLLPFLSRGSPLWRAASPASASLWAVQKPNSFCSAISMPGKIKRRRSGAALRPFELWAEKLVSSILMKKRL